MTETEQLDQKIRRMARADNLVAKKSRRDGKWYFADFNNRLISPENGLTEDGVLEWFGLGWRVGIPAQ